MKRWTLELDALYLCDNGAIYCGAHLGATARASGCDLSGQPIHRLSDDDVAELARLGTPAACECCAAMARREERL